MKTKITVKPLSVLCRVCNIVFLILFGVVTVASATIQDELLQKAIHITEDNTWIPGQVIQHEQVKNIKGKIEEENETHIQLARGQQGNIAVTILQAISNGKDVTEKARKDAESEVAPDEILDLSNPFEEIGQENLTMTRLNQKKSIQGKHCVAFQYRLDVQEEKKEVTLEGLAWLEESTGVPYEIESEITSLPLKEDKLTINAFKQIDRYDYKDGQWMPVESVMNMDIEFKAFLIKFKGTVHSVSQYSQHWKL